MSRLAIIAGGGALPAALAAGLTEPPLICVPDGYTPEGLAVDLTFRIERLAPFLRTLQDNGVACVTFAGAVRRPRMDPALFDPETARMVPRLLSAMAGGDDATLREVIAIFEEAGMKVVGIADIAPLLVPGAGVLVGDITAADERDATRAAAIMQAVGAADVGQGCVVAQGLCLAVEALPGTDAMLSQVAGLGDLRPDPRQGAGLFYKAAKPGQDRRIDLPTLGPATVIAADAAGLAGIVWAAGEVICLDLPGMIVEAQARGLFLWAR